MITDLIIHIRNHLIAHIIIHISTYTIITHISNYIIFTHIITYRRGRSRCKTQWRE
jgi:hypothetical protein